MDDDGAAAARLLERARALGVRIWLEDDRLKVNAPKGVLDDALKAELARHKAALVERLRAAVDEHAAILDRSAPLPLWHTQQRLWFLKQMDPGNVAYQVTVALTMEGALDVGAVERAIADLVARHESLRTRFVAVDGTPRCVIEPQARVPLERFDLSAVPQAARDAAVVETVLQFVYRPFDIARAPLMRAVLVRLGPESHVMCLVQDHIVSDGLSMAIFVLEFRALYTQHVGGAAAALPPLAAQYVDIVARQRRSLEGGRLAGHLDYWKRQLAGLPPALSLPTDRPRPPVQTYRGGRLLRHFPRELATRVHAMARAEGATSFMVVLAAFNVLLHRYTGATDIPVGTAVANRTVPGADGVIGFFANNIVLRGDLAGRPAARELLARVRETSLDGMSHQEVPFEMLIDVLGTRRELDHAPLFQVMFVQHGVGMTRLELPGVTCGPYQIGTPAARFDLSVDLFDAPDGMHVYFEYNTDLFDAATIERMMGHYRRLLESFVANPAARVDELAMLDPDEERRLVTGWSATARDYPREATVHGLFEAQAARAPGATAVVFDEARLSYAELNARANRLARHLRSLGVGRDSLVGVWMERSEQMVVALLGILKAGAAYVPLDPAFPKDRVDYMIEDAALSVVVTQERLATSLPARIAAVCVDRDAAALAQWPEGDLEEGAGPRDLAYVIYTSGSTGRPKGVELEHRGVVNFLCSMHREPGISAADRFVSVTTLSFDIAGLEIHGPLTCGGMVVLASRATALDGHRLAALLERSGATILQATPATWRVLLESGWHGLPRLKMLCGGEALPRDLAERLLTLEGELWNMYGPTETTIWSTLTRVSDTTRAIPIGRPIANTQVYVLEASGLPAPIGVGGELCIGGDGLARGYRNRPELTAEKFVTIDLPEVGATRVYRTGDVVRFLADGQLEYVGRRDHQVKVRGFRIELGEIEAVLATQAGVRECVVHVREDTPGDQRLVGYVVPAAGADFQADAARSALRAKLPEYMIPNLFVTLEALPLTPNGKVDRKALPMPRAATVAAGGEHEAMMTPAQRKVASLWQQVLGVDRVGLGVNFFDLGGHSLLLVKLQAALQREFGRELPLVELFQRTTVAAQAERLTAPQASPAALQRAQARAARQND